MKALWHIGGAVLLICASCVLAVIVAEYILRLTPLRAYAPRAIVVTDYMKFDPDEGMLDIAPGRATTTHHFIDGSYPLWSNELGCFDTSFATGTAPFVYLTGDSFTWGFARFEDKWGTVLQDLLGQRVAKCGVLGFGTAQELIKARELLKTIGRPSLIVVGYYGSTDPGDDRWFEEYARGEHSQTSRWFCPSEAGTWRQRVICRLSNSSVLYNLAKREVLALLPSAMSSRIEKALAVPLPDDSPLTEADRVTHEENIMGFHDLARSHEAQLLFVLIPKVGELSSEPSSAVSNARTKAFLEAHGIDYIDLLPHLRSYVEQTGESLYWERDPHFNVLGNHLVAGIVARYVVDHHLAPSDIEAQMRISAYLAEMSGKSGGE